MYKTSVPVAIQSLSDDNTEKDLNKYLDYFKKGKADRIFIAVLPGAYSNAFEIDITSYKFKRTIEFFKENGFEVGVWISAFGHGCTLSYDEAFGIKPGYTSIVDASGNVSTRGFCPLDEKFSGDYMQSVKKIAALNPDMIMLDDDFRINQRNGCVLSCFCEKHLKEFYRLCGEEIPREKIDSLIFSGGKNKYRDAYLKMTRETLLGFAKKIRTAINEVNPEIRAGVCMGSTTWDLEGTDALEISKAFAGDTKPFFRCCGAPYYTQFNMINVIEEERMQFAWVKNANSETEIFAEGDTYPRPRYNVSSKCLELFELALMCDGNSDGILKYMFPYDLPVGYEPGYIDRHIKQYDLRTQVAELFRDKTPTGVCSYQQMHKIPGFELPPVKTGETGYAKVMALRTDCDILAANSIPVCYGNSEYPVTVSGENARSIPPERLKNGALLDATAAKILKERGIDTGLTEICGPLHSHNEYYTGINATVTGISSNGFRTFFEITCDKKAEILSTYSPCNAPSSYRYENADGIRFLVFAADFRFTSFDAANYYNNYYRKKQLVSTLEWLGKKKLPVVFDNEKHPNMYVLASENDRAMSVLLLNVSPDDCEMPSLTLSKECKKIKFVNCDGNLNKNKVTLSDIPPYGFAAFEIEK